MRLQYIDEELLFRVLSVPSFSEREIRMQEFLADYANEKGLDFYMDKTGNVYIKKGEVSEGEFFPCVSAHMDTVHREQIPFIEENTAIPLITEKLENGNHKIFADGFGLGGDDKAGIAVALSVLEQSIACKAVFFTQEEYGCIGSDNADLSWFKDVGYILCFDSPGSNCASFSCGGVPLFDKLFFDTYLEELSEKYGLSNYFHHPYTDAMNLRMNTCLACMNIGAGYYEYHSRGEYVIAEEMDKAVAIGIHLISQIGRTECLIPCEQ